MLGFFKSKIVLSLLVILLAFSACKNSDQEGGQIFLSFDDQYIENWYSYRDLFKEYDAKAVFYVTRPEELTKEDFKMLRELQNDGHKIGSHGYKHINISEFATPSAYFEKEVLPAIKIFSENNINIDTYAYPYGKGSYKTDSVLNSHGITCRSADWNWEHKWLHKLDRFYIRDADKSMNFMALGIDENYEIGRLDIVYGLKRAQEENSTLVLHAHKISKENMDYRLHPGKLEFLLKQCEKRGIEFYQP